MYYNIVQPKIRPYGLNFFVIKLASAL